MSIELDRSILIFQEMGLTRIEGLILCALMGDSHMSHKGLEKSTGISQPEISMGVKSLIGRKWVAELLKTKEPGMRRPQKRYTLRVDGEQIYTDLCRGYSNKIDIQKANLKELKDILKVK